MEGVEWTATIDGPSAAEKKRLSLDVVGIGSEQQRWSLQSDSLFLEEGRRPSFGGSRFSDGETASQAPEAEWSEEQPKSFLDAPPQ